jgi:serine/threonine protein kinase/predicted ATPase
MPSIPEQPHFRLGRELGTGTGGRVFHAVLTRGFGPYPAGFELAVKYQHAALEAESRARAAFDAEVAAGRAVLHPAIVHVIHSGRDERGRFVVMPFVPGRNLREVARDSGILPEPLLRSIARQISGGLAALHAAGFVHGDIKPENIRLDAEGNAVLLDLGFAHAPRPDSGQEPIRQDGREGVAAPDEALHAERVPSLARPRSVAARPGSLPYISPEQARGELGDFAADVFSLCVVLYELVTGVHPFASAVRPAKRDAVGSVAPHALVEGVGSSAWIARTAIEKPDADTLIAAIATARFVAPSRRLPELSPFLDLVLQDGLQRDPARRPDSREMHQRFTDQESGTWWRSEIEFEVGARRGGSGERDAQHSTPLVGRERELDELLAAYEAAVESSGASHADASETASATTDTIDPAQARDADSHDSLGALGAARAPGASDAHSAQGAPAPRADPGSHRRLRALPAASRDVAVAAIGSSAGAEDRGKRVDELRAASRSTHGGVVWIRGEPGLGKSRLVNEFASRARTRMNPPLYLYGRCREFEEDRPCQPILRLLERYLRLPPGVAPKERERALLDKLVPPRAAETLARVLDPSYEGTTPLSVLVALSVWLAALGKRVPLIIFLDDVNWAGEDTLNVLTLLAERLDEARLLLVLGSRGDARARAPQALARARERLASRVRTWDIELAPLDERAVEAFVHRVFHHSTPRLRLASVLWQRSRGNPGLLSELLRGLIARGEAPQHPSGEGRMLTISPDDLPLPGSLQKAIRESFKLLPASDRTWLRRLAVVGGRIETEFLLKAFPDASRAEVDPMLARLVHSGWLKPAGARYRFTRPALREAVYRSLTRDQRTRLHAAAAEALRPAIGEHLSLEDAFQIAFHLRAAQDHTTLLRLLKPLLARLLRSGQPQRVHPLALWGLEAIDQLPRSRDSDRMRIELLEAAVDAADRLGFRQGQRELLDRLTDLEIDPNVDPEAVGRVYLLHGRYAVSTGQYGLARGMLRNAVDMFERSGKELEHSEALRRLSLVQGHVGELGEARALARRALETAQHDPQRALAHLALGTVDVLEDRVEPALRNTDTALSLMRRDPSFHLPGIYAAAYMLRARVYRIAGAPARALASANRAVRLARIAGERRLEAEATARLGGMLLDLDRSDEAESRLRAALLLAEEIEDRRGQALARLFLGTLLWENGDPEAQSMLGRTERLAVEMGLNRVEAVSLSIQARIRRERGDAEGALAASARAASLLKQYGAELADRIVILGTRVLVLKSLGQSDAALGIEKRLRDRLRRETARIRSPLLRLRHGRAAERLLEAVLSADGPVYPRVREAE